MYSKTTIFNPLGLALSSVRVAGALGWRLVQQYHVSIQLTPSQQADEIAIQASGPKLHLLHRKSA